MITIYIFIFRGIWPLDQHFFLLKAKDKTRSYEPETKCVIDIPSAIHLFKGAETTDQLSQLIEIKATELAKRWNDTFGTKVKQ